MHKYLRAVGFSEVETRQQYMSLAEKVVKESDKREYMTFGKSSLLTEFSKDIASDIGLRVCGELDDEDRFQIDYCFPYLNGKVVSTQTSVNIDRHADKLSFAGVCEDNRLGITIIFYLNNRLDYLRMLENDTFTFDSVPVSLSGLSLEGTIMMPIAVNPLAQKKAKASEKNRMKLLEAAKSGDEAAIETLTLEDIDTYSSISKRIKKNDVFSLVSTYVMPFGVECDQYSVLGEIVDCKVVTNKITGEEIYRMLLKCNDILLDMCVNKKDVFGEPKIGRRYRGNIWLQARLDFKA